MAIKSMSDDDLLSLSLKSNPYRFQQALQASDIEQISRIYLDYGKDGYYWRYCRPEIVKIIIGAKSIKFTDEHINWMIADGTYLLEVLRRHDLRIRPEVLEQIYTNSAPNPLQWIDYELGKRLSFHIGVRWSHILVHRPYLADGKLESNESGVPSLIINKHLNAIRDSSFSRRLYSALKNKSFDPDGSLLKRILNEATDDVKLMAIEGNAHLMRHRDILRAMKTKNAYLQTSLASALAVQHTVKASSNIVTSPSPTRSRPRM